MKTSYWMGLIAIALVLSLGLGLWLLRPQAPKSQVTVIQEGRVVTVLDLSRDQTLTFTNNNGGTNTVEIENGKVAVTQANCPDHLCISMGPKNSGAPIACLPNGLILSFDTEESLDGVVG